MDAIYQGYYLHFQNTAVPQIPEENRGFWATTTAVRDAGLPAYGGYVITESPEGVVNLLRMIGKLGLTPNQVTKLAEDVDAAFEDARQQLRAAVPDHYDEADVGVDVGPPIAAGVGIAGGVTCDVSVQIRAGIEWDRNHIGDTEVADAF